jgi:hypothetical protein
MDHSGIFVINTIKQIQDNLKHQRTKVSRLVPFFSAIVLGMADLILSIQVLCRIILAWTIMARLLIATHVVFDYGLCRHELT